jgi:HAD superfamily hydrolase (TIGR01549 family)
MTLDVKLALFDLDNTLVDRTGCYRAWAERYCAETGLDAEAVEWFCQADRDGFAPRDELWSAARLRFSLSPTVEELIASYRSQVLESYHPDVEVNGALTKLSEAGYVVGVITNGDTATQVEKARRAGLIDLVATVCVSEEVGVYKPDPAIFRAAIERCGSDLSSAEATGAWMVGDAPGPDIGGAQGLGLRTIWMSRGRTWVVSGPEPEITVETIPQAVEVILTEGSKTTRQ